MQSALRVKGWNTRGRSRDTPLGLSISTVNGLSLLGGAGKLCSGVSFSSAKARRFFCLVSRNKQAGSLCRPPEVTALSDVANCRITARVSRHVVLCLSTGTQVAAPQALKSDVLTVRLKIVSTSHPPCCGRVSPVLPMRS